MLEDKPQNPDERKIPHKRVLGRGLASLLPIPEENQSLNILDTEKIYPNPNQPRRSFEKEKLEELAKSVAENGILQPILVRATENGRYEIIAGERRWRAAQMAQLKKVPVIIREADKPVQLELALIENIQRENLNPIDEAMAYQRLSTEFEYSHEKIAKKVGKERATVTNSIRLLQLPVTVQEMVRVGDLTMGHARALLSVPDQKHVEQLAQEILKKRLSVRETEKGIHKRFSKKSVEKKDPEIFRVEQNLQRLYSTKVNMILRGNKGAISFDFYSLDDMNRLIQLLTQRF